MTRRAYELGGYRSFEQAVSEAARLHEVYVRKFSHRPNPGPYRVRKRRSRYGGPERWGVYTPSGWIPDRRGY